jgi:hypothetical protein
MYDPAAVKTLPDFPVPGQMKASVLGDPDELLLRDKPMPVPSLVVYRAASRDACRRGGRIGTYTEQ